MSPQPASEEEYPVIFDFVKLVEGNQSKQDTVNDGKEDMNNGDKKDMDNAIYLMTDSDTETATCRRSINRFEAIGKRLAEGSMSIEELHSDDLISLHRLNPDRIPTTIKDKLVNLSATMKMRMAVAATIVDAADYWNKIIEVQGDLLDAPMDSILIHACNTAGRWGKGIARQIRIRYPNAFEVYRQYCSINTRNKKAPLAHLGKCLLIPPQQDSRMSGPNHWIACLFTKIKTGPKLDPRDDILKHTKSALEEMKHQVEQVRSGQSMSWYDGKHPGEYWTCRLNSGLFGVEWSATKEVLKGVDIPVVVVHPIPRPRRRYKRNPC